jgi:hypothetical protein
MNIWFRDKTVSESSFQISHNLELHKYNVKFETWGHLSPEICVLYGFRIMRTILSRKHVGLNLER